MKAMELSQQIIDAWKAKDTQAALTAINQPSVMPFQAVLAGVIAGRHNKAVENWLFNVVAREANQLSSPVGSPSMYWQILERPRKD